MKTFLRRSISKRPRQHPYDSTWNIPPGLISGAHHQTAQAPDLCMCLFPKPHSLNDFFCRQSLAQKSIRSGFFKRMHYFYAVLIAADSRDNGRCLGHLVYESQECWTDIIFINSRHAYTPNGTCQLLISHWLIFPLHLKLNHFRNEIFQLAHRSAVVSHFHIFICDFW